MYYAQSTDDKERIGLQEIRDDLQLRSGLEEETRIGRPRPTSREVFAATPPQLERHYCPGPGFFSWLAQAWNLAPYSPPTDVPLEGIVVEPGEPRPFPRHRSIPTKAVSQQNTSILAPPRRTSEDYESRLLTLTLLGNVVRPFSPLSKKKKPL